MPRRTDPARDHAHGADRPGQMVRIVGECAVTAVATWLVAACASGPSAEDAREIVAARERSFAQSMARRDFEAFGTFLSEDAVFMSGTRALRGKAQVVQAWQRFFATPAAPFTWEPDQVEVLGSGTLAWSTGPVRDPAGKVIARFQSVWRLEPSGVWRIVLDKGVEACECPTAAGTQ